jgi:hypothetical protein
MLLYFIIALLLIALLINHFIDNIVDKIQIPVEHFTMFDDSRDDSDNDARVRDHDMTRVREHDMTRVVVPCTQPTISNPFMNQVPGNNTSLAPACNVETNHAAMDKQDKFRKLGLYKDINNIYDGNNNQRQFITQPSTTIPNDREKWAEACFGIKGSCRDGDMDYCLQFNTIQTH